MKLLINVNLRGAQPLATGTRSSWTEAGPKPSVLLTTPPHTGGSEGWFWFPWEADSQILSLSLEDASISYTFVTQDGQGIVLSQLYVMLPVKSQAKVT